jgi:DNA-binding MarR family transcriptional regulator
MPFDHETLSARFGQIWPVHVERFSELLITLRQHFGGDLDRMLVLAIIGSRTLHQRRAEGLTYDDFPKGNRSGLPVNPINVQSVAECSGIPRETVRRKVRDLENMGWIERHEGGVLAATEKAAHDLAPATEATMQYLLAVGSACVEATHQHQAGRASRSS